jgi:ATP-dependent RNA helicase RhlE
MPPRRFVRNIRSKYPDSSRGPQRRTGARPPFRGRPSGGSGGSRRPQGRGRFAGEHIDVARFINKATITETVEHFVPEHRFTDFPIDSKVKEAITKKGYIDPTPIQDRAIPHVLKGGDVVGIANTGTGKTAAFLIPLLHKILTNKGERALIMVPTRELATQIADELRGFSKDMPILGAVCVGGAAIGAQIAALRRHPHFIIGTPGRLKDLIERKVLMLSDVRTAVLDEADRMLDMGFIHDMKKILALLPEQRQTLFFSATLSPEIERLIGQFLKEPARISVKTRETASGIDQDIVRIPPGGNKFDVLRDLLSQPEFNKVLVFGRTKHGVEKLAKALVQKGFRAESIHGNKTQGHRQRALDLFKRDHVQVLVATDVAARGLDINGVSHVINYDLPGSHDDYVHRIGRTGRAGKKGKALTFIE